MGIQEVLKQVNKVYGPGTLIPADKAVSLVVDRLPTGIPDLDWKIGGGFPRGRITMLKGDFSTGKSVICDLLVASAQRTCRYCGKPFKKVLFGGECVDLDCECGRREPMVAVWMDAEHSFDPIWATKWGVDASKLYILETEYAEQAIDVAEKCIRSKECDLLVVDSVAALTPGIEVTESSENQQIGAFARLMNKALRKWTSGLNSYGLVAQTKCTIALINQMRVKIGGYHPTPTSPGGRGLDFFESLEIRLKRVAWIEDPRVKRQVGITVEFAQTKNKTAPASSGGMFSLYFVTQPGSYVVGDTDIDSQVLRAATYWGLVEKKGGWYEMQDGAKYHGLDAAKMAVREVPGLLEKLIEDVTLRELAWQSTGEVSGPIGDLSGE
jgi:recombination protein RecA